MEDKSSKAGDSSLSVADFLGGIKNKDRQQDTKRLIRIMRKITGHAPAMWGTSVIGFGRYHYKYASGREGDMAAASFSPRAANIAIYLLEGTSFHDALLQKLGPHTASKGCVYIKRLDDVNQEVLEELIKKSYAYIMAQDSHMHRARKL